MSHSKPSSSTKELKIVTRPVVTIDAVKRDLKKMRLLHIVKLMEQVSERGLTMLLYKLRDVKDFDLGYRFIVINNIPNSKDLLEDVRVLLYLGLLETDLVTRRLKLTSAGREFLDKEGGVIGDEELSKLKEMIEELKPAIRSEDTATEMLLREVKLLKGRRRRRRR